MFLLVAFTPLSPRPQVRGRGETKIFSRPRENAGETRAWKNKKTCAGCRTHLVLSVSGALSYSPRTVTLSDAVRTLSDAVTRPTRGSGRDMVESRRSRSVVATGRSQTVKLGLPVVGLWLEVARLVRAIVTLRSEVGSDNLTAMSHNIGGWNSQPRGHRYL